jgi:hypothetical protein
VALSKLKSVLIWVAAVVGLVASFPGTVGYAWAMAWLPIYGTICHVDKVFGSDVSPDGYRIFILNRGCDVDAAIRQIVATATDLSVDPGRIIAIYHGTARANTADESLAMDLVHSRLREYAGTRRSADNCTPHCAIPDDSGDDPIAKWVNAYRSYARTQFFYTATDGADYIASILRVGPIVQSAVFLAYLATAIYLGIRVMALVLSRVRGSAKSQRASWWRSRK